MKSVIRLGLIIAAAVLFCASLLPTTGAQRRLGPFSHATKAHKEGKYKDCSACHTLPTENWTSPRRDKQEPFPDVVNFPYKKHTTCFGCHIADVYSGGGAFCGNCHVTPTMRATGGRGVLPFPHVKHSRQFNTVFPHDVHQDLIASNRPKPDFAPAHFGPTAFTQTDDEKPVFYNCAICHTTAAKMPKYGARKPSSLRPLVDAVTDIFEKPLSAQFFKGSPEGHASCFTCHYQYKNLPEGKRSCAGCHAPTQPYFEKSAIERYSLKFSHESGGHSIKDCTSCHVRITQNSDVRAMKDADVPIVACRSCHAVQENDPDKRALITEIEMREATVAEKRPIFQCTYCHTSAIGRYEIPASHQIK